MTDEQLKKSGYLNQAYHLNHIAEIYHYKALENLAYAYGYLLNCDSSLTCTFGDSVLEDTDKEFQRRLQMITAGLLSKEQFISWYFGCSVEEAVQYMPVTSDLFGGEK